MGKQYFFEKQFCNDIKCLIAADTFLTFFPLAVKPAIASLESQRKAAQTEMTRHSLGNTSLTQSTVSQRVLLGRLCWNVGTEDVSGR